MSVYHKENPCIIVFKIEDITVLGQDEGFLTACFDFLDVKIFLNFYFDEGGLCSCFLEVPESGYLSINYRFELLCNDNSVLRSGEFENEFQLQPRTSEWVNFIKYDEILENKETYLFNDCLTVHVFLWGMSIRLPNLKRILCYSRALADGNCSLTWNIEKLKTNYFYLTKCIFSNGSSFVVKLMCTENNHIRVFLEITKGNFYIKTTILCQTKLPALADTEVQHCQYVSDEEIVKVPSFNIGDNPQDISLKCKFSLFLVSHSRNAINEYEFENNVENSSNNIPSAVQDFLFMYNNQKITDICLQADGKKLFAHKFVLISRSPVFSAMFEHDTFEKQNNIVIVEDVSFDILKDFLSYLYGAPLQNLNYEKCIELMKPAEKYQVISLKHECSSFLQNNLCEESFCKILLISDILHEKQLKTASIYYFKNNCQQILKSKDWEKLTESHKDLALEVLTILAKSL